VPNEAEVAGQRRGEGKGVGGHTSCMGPRVHLVPPRPYLIFTSPLWLISTLAGLMSRWIWRSSCRYARPYPMMERIAAWPVNGRPPLVPPIDQQRTCKTSREMCARTCSSAQPPLSTMS
jgi:hypothetical protein